jgi:hypothetical protein
MRIATLLSCILVSFVQDVFAGLTILHGPTYATGTSRTAATFVYLGPRYPNLKGSTICLSGNEACNPPRSVQGLIAISILSDLDCDLGDAYTALQGAQAEAFITLERWSPPGWYCFRKAFGGWSGGTMPIVSVSWLDGDKDLWTDPRLEVAIDPPFDTTVYDAYVSLDWTISLKVVAAGWALLVGMKSLIELFGLYHSEKMRKSWISCAIFAIEAPTMLLIGVMLILGHGGPYTLPFVYHTFFVDLLSGFSVASTLLLALFLREEASHFRTGLPRQEVWNKYRRFFIITGAFLSTGSAILIPIGFFVSMSSTKASEIVSRTVLTSALGAVYITVLVPCQCCISIIFLVHVSASNLELDFFFI